MIDTYAGSVRLALVAAPLSTSGLAPDFEFRLPDLPWPRFQREPPRDRLGEALRLEAAIESCRDLADSRDALRAFLTE